MGFSVVGQVGTKIKDNSIPGTPSNPVPGAVFEVESNMRGVLFSRLTTAERDAIPTSSLINGLTIYNTTTNCYNYYQSNIQTWLSMCGTLPQASLGISVAQCNAITVQGIYKVGEPLNQTNSITIPVTVTQPGTYEITVTANGFTFEKMGAFPSVGNYVLTLQGAGTPVAAGTETVSIAINNVAQSCTFNIDVAVAETAFTILCSSIALGGSYAQSVALDASNTLTLTVNVTVAGNYTINTNTVNGYSFSASGNFTTLGNQTVVLQGTGTPQFSGTNVLTLIGNVTTAGTCIVNIPVVTSPAAYTVNCGAIAVNGSYMMGIGMTAMNTMTVPVTVNNIGNYTISTDNVNGISFSGSGTFSGTGTQNITLTATGIPNANGSFLYTISNLGVNCTKSIAFTSTFRVMKVLGLGQLYSSSGSDASKEILLSPVNFGLSGTVPIQEIKFFNISSLQGDELKYYINSSNIDVILIGFQYYPTLPTVAVLTDFVKNKKGVLINGSNMALDYNKYLTVNICGEPIHSNFEYISTSTPTSLLWRNLILNVSDPILEGPFGDIKGKATGYSFYDSNTAYESCVTNGLPGSLKPLVTFNGELDKITMFRHRSLGYVYFGDNRWMSGNATDGNTIKFPAKISPEGKPLPKPYNGGIMVYNSILYANTLAWAFKYVQENTNTGYIIP